MRGERARSIGFDLDPDLTDAREKALNYAKGEMPDIVSLPNRSHAVSTDIADAVETILPDLVEIFTGGDDVVAFVPKCADDEPQADQETDYVRHVVFDDKLVLDDGTQRVELRYILVFVARHDQSAANRLIQIG